MQASPSHMHCILTCLPTPLCRVVLCLSVQWVYPFAGAIDTELPAPPRSVHMMLKHKADWVEPQVGSV